MSYQITCPNLPVLAVDITAGAEFQHEVLSCPGGWVITQATPFDFAQLIELLTFDYATFGTLFGISIILFITGHSAGHVARNLGRV